VDKQVWNSCRSPDAFICYESRAEGFLIAHQFHRSRFDDFLHRNTAALLATGGPINPAPNAYLLVRCQLYHSTLRDSRDRTALGACRPRDSGLDHIAICFIKKHVVPNAETGLPTNLTTTHGAGLAERLHKISVDQIAKEAFAQFVKRLRDTKSVT